MAVDLQAIKDAARGRWLEIIPALTSIPAERLDGRQHYPCPKCGGVDRFREFDDFAETGGVYCNQCHAEKNRDGISTIQWDAGTDFKTVSKMLAEYLGVNSNGKAHVANGNGRAPTKAKKAANEATLTKGIEPVKTQEAREAALNIYCKAKPPITPQGIEKCGGSIVRWYGEPCIRLDGRAPIDIREREATGTTRPRALCNVDLPGLDYGDRWRRD